MYLKSLAIGLHAIIVAAYPNTPVARHLSTHGEIITIAVDAATYHGVDPVLLLAVSFAESGLGRGRDPAHPNDEHAFGVTRAALVWACSRGDGYLPGARGGSAARCNGDPLHDQAEAAAIVLRYGAAMCSDEEGVIWRYNTGSCAPHHPSVPTYLGDVQSVLRRIRPAASRLVVVDGADPR